MSNSKTVEEIYEAFGRGDIQLILDKLADDVEWDYGYKIAPNPVPWFKASRGKSGAASFFENLKGLQFHSFVPKAILEGPGVVVGLVDLEATVKKTGKRIVETDEAHVWRFNEEGKIIRFRHCADTYQQTMAYEGQKAAMPAE